MSLAFNRETAVNQTDKIERKEDLSYYRQPVTYSAQSDTNLTVTADFIATGILFFCECSDDTGASRASMTVTLLGQTILGCSVDGDNSTGVSDSVFCPLPEWFIPAGTIINFNENEANGNAGASVIGFLL